MSFNPKNIVIIGASGAIGSAFMKILTNKYSDLQIFAFSRNSEYYINYKNEESIANAAKIAAKDKPIDLIIVASGILHTKDIMPEKSLKDLSARKFHDLFEVNTIGPALVIKYFLPKLNKKSSRFAILSARIGSISDNILGGWYSYRASKAALNMIIKNVAIELRIQNKLTIIVGLHPGTVDSNLSKPFQGNIIKERLFTPEYSARKLLDILNNLTLDDSGKCFAWDGMEIQP